MSRNLVRSAYCVLRKVSIRNTQYALRILCLLLALSGWLAVPHAALAHSKLLSSSPTAGAVLDTPPQEIQMAFSEAVGLDFSTVKIYDRARNERPVGELSHPGGDQPEVRTDRAS